jgi:threonine efflux protein
MDEYTFLIGIAIALTIGVISPGPSFIVVAQTAVEKNRMHGVATALGMGCGAATFALLAALGLYFVLESVPWLYLVLKIVGGFYLCFLAYKIWKSANEPMAQSTAHAGSGTSLFKSYLFGLATQLSNPKTAIVFAGVFATFLPAQVPQYSYYLLCSLAFVIDAGWYALVAVVLSTSNAQLAYAKYKKHINRVAGGLIGLMGLKLASSQ